jgi:hypothetical protein
MTNDEFLLLLEKDPALARPIHAATCKLPGQAMAFGSPTEWAAIAVIFPVAVFIVRNIGLPWLHEASRHSELWRLKFHEWIDTQYEKEGFDPDEAEVFGEALRVELEHANDEATRTAWEQLSALVKNGD